MTYLFGSGLWTLWYAALWISLSPFVAMTVALTRAAPNEPTAALETAFAVSTVGLFVLVGATAIGVGLVFIFGAGYYAVTPKQPMVNRWLAQLVCLGSAIGLFLFCVHATWRFRHR